MTAFPYYESTALAALSTEAAAILKCFVARGYIREEPSILQPAEIFLDRSGEEIRRRTFTLTDLSGRELCLRPDLTIPICKRAVENRVKFPARICYNGLAFRHQPSEPARPTQFFQAGAELLGLENREAGETEIMTLAVEALHAAGLDSFEMKIGDLALFGALIDALDVPLGWRARLKRHFWRAGYFEALLARLGSETRCLPATRADIEARIDVAGGAPLGGRSREDIVARAMEQAADAALLHLDPKVARVITRLLDVSGSAEAALAEIRRLLKGAGIEIDAPLAAMETRLATLKSLGIDPARIRFAAHFGRNLEYYTGFVFELWSSDAEGPVQVAGGGRYDNLLEALGADRAIPAIGCAIRTERVVAARRFGARA